MGESLRVVSFNVFPPAYRIVAEWAARHRHQVVLLVTVPGHHARRYESQSPPLLDILPEGQDVLITDRMRRTAAPTIAALRPDLVIVASFPLRIPPEVTAIPRYGAINLHPSPLPRGRGPNPARGVYEGDPTIAYTAHRVEADFDAGAILSRRETARPDDLGAGDLVRHWLEMAPVVLEEAACRAVAGEWGVPQDRDAATHWPPFTEEERWLDWGEGAAIVQRRAAALNAIAPTARALIDGRAVIVRDVRALPGLVHRAAAGTVLDREGDLAVVSVGDGVVSVRTRPPLAVPPDGKADERPRSRPEGRASGAKRSAASTSRTSSRVMSPASVAVKTTSTRKL